MKKFIMGIILGAVLATASNAIANSEVVAKFISFNFVVNGEPIQVESQPVSINGSSYLPVRELANLLGYDVTYKADTKTIELNLVQNTSDINSTNAKSTSNLEQKVNLNIVVSGKSEIHTVFINNGEPYLKIGTLIEVFKALNYKNSYGTTYTTLDTMELAGHRLVINDINYLFKFDEPEIVYIKEKPFNLNVSSHIESVGLNGKEQYIPLEFFVEQKLINFDLDNNNLTLTQ
jgi:hypothetical protein